MSTVEVIEMLSVETLLGYRFLDAATGRQVISGLQVTARLEGGSDVRAEAIRTVSGHHAFQGLPGLRLLEYRGEDIDLLPGSPPTGTPYIVEVEDLEERFTPVVHRVHLPLETAASPPGGGSPPDGGRLRDFYLFSAPTRTTAPGLAAVRTRLVDAGGEAIAHAMLEVEAGAQRGYGISDAEGRVAALFPYPAVETTLSGSPPSGQTSLRRATWTLTVRVRHAPAELDYAEDMSTPTLGSICSQSYGEFLADPLASPVASADELNETLTFGEAVVMRTDGEPLLYIIPGS